MYKKRALSILLLAVTLVLGACSSDASAIEGTWRLVEFDDQTVEGEVNTRDIPELDFADGEMSGDFGCNSGSGSFDIAGDMLRIGEVSRNASRCISDGTGDPMLAETVLQSVFAGNIAVEFDDSAMTWTQDESVLVFERTS